jgi:hypothetical protein
MTVATAVDVLPRRMAGWAARRSLAPNALTGIGLACGLCAAAWFTAGTRLDAIAGGLALCAGYLARRVRTQLVAVSDGGAAVAGAAGFRGASGATTAMQAGFEVWLASVGAAVGELAVYAGLAVGAWATQRHGIWLLATEAAITLSIRQVARVGQPGLGQPGRGQHARAAALAPRSSLALLAGRFLALPTGARTIVIVVTAPIWGARITFLALIIWGAAAAGWEIVRSVWMSSRAGLSPGLSPGGVAAGGWIAGARDDGPAARRAGQLVRGQLVPLPPALAGLAAVGLLAVLGLGNLTGLLALAPVAAMLLAAPGASHPHDGRLDWLVPLVLLGAQYIYLAAIGFSAGVPGPVTFGLISVVALRQLDVACRARQQASAAGSGAAGAGAAGWPTQPSGLGWDGRILVVGLAALLGFVTFAYLALAAYLGFLLCRAVLSGWLALREPYFSEGDRR